MKKFFEVLGIMLLFSVMYSCGNTSTFKEYCQTSKKASDAAIDSNDYYKLRYEAKIYDGGKKSLSDFCEGK